MMRKRLHQVLVQTCALFYCLKHSSRLRRLIPAVNNQLPPLHCSTAAAHVVLATHRVHLEARKHAPDTTRRP